MIAWRVSAAWVTRQHDCTLHGIETRCGGACCYSTKYWPPAAFGAINGRCGHLGDAGCVLGPADKPVKCHLYPLLLRNGLLQQHFRVTCSSKGLCKGNHGQGPMLIDALRDGIIHLFGQDQYDKLRADVLAGRDGMLMVPDHVAKAYEAEAAEEASMQKVPPRSQRCL